MNTAYSIDEILEIAIKIERNGSRFYEKASEFCHEHSGYLKFLARQEKQHLEKFLQMQKELKIDHEKRSIMEDLDDQVGMYLSTIAAGVAFKNTNNPVMELEGHESALEILSIALEHEKETMLFYSGLVRYITDKKEREVLEQIINEEMDHIVDISNRLKGIEEKLSV